MGSISLQPLLQYILNDLAEPWSRWLTLKHTLNQLICNQWMKYSEWQRQTGDEILYVCSHAGVSHLGSVIASCSQSPSWWSDCLTRNDLTDMVSSYADCLGPIAGQLCVMETKVPRSWRLSGVMRCCRMYLMARGWRFNTWFWNMAGSPLRFICEK